MTALDWRDDVNAPVEAEVGLLGAAFADPSGEAAQVLFGVDLEDFALPHARSVASAVAASMNGHPTPDPVAVAALLRERGEASALTFLVEKLWQWPTGANAPLYADRIRFFARRRDEKRLRDRLSAAVTRSAQDVAARDLEAFLALGDEVRRDEPWPERTPLDAHERPAFPVDALPRAIAEWASAVAVSLQVPVDLAAMIALPVIAAACARKWEVEVRSGWREPLNAYFLTAMQSGSRKSAAFKKATDVLYQFEAEAIEEGRKDYLRAKYEFDMVEKRVAATNTARATARNSVERNKAEADYLAAMKELETTPEPPAELRLVGDDVTPERAVQIMAEQGDRFAIFSAEGGMLQTLAGSRYSKTASPSYDALLKAHAGDPISHDRKTSDPVRVAHPALTLGLSVQPEVLRALAAAPGARGLGLLARFLYSVPTSEVGARTVRPPPVPADVEMTYRLTVGRLLARQLPPEPEILTFTCYADDALAAFEAELEPRLGPDGDLAGMVEWASKLAGAVARTAAWIALAETDERIDLVEVRHVEAAIRIGRYLLSHARTALGSAEAFPEITTARRVLDWAERHGLREFSAQDALKALHHGGGEFQRIGQVQPALDVLVETGHARRVESRRTGRPGRPKSPIYELAPVTKP